MKNIVEKVLEEKRGNGMKRRTATKWIIAGLVVVILIAGFTIIKDKFAERRLAMMQLQLQTETVRKGDINVKVNGSGKIASETSANLKPAGSGTIAEIKVANNSSVIAGDELVTFEESNMESIVAPFDGVVYFSPDIEEGVRINPDLTVATVFDPNKLEMVVDIDELDIDEIKADQRAEIEIAAFPDETFTGTVTEVASMSDDSAEAVYSTYRVVIDITDDARVKPGMSAEAKVFTQDKKDALYVPVNAVQKKGDAYYVQVVSTSAQGQSVTTEKKVEVGIHNEQVMEITEGLAEGEKVVIPSAEKTLSDSESQQGSRALMMQQRGGGGK